MTGRGEVTVFAPSPIVTVTVEDRAGSSELHVHAGGQGVWQARMLASLGAPVCLCAALGGETGRLLEKMIAVDGVELRTVTSAARNGGYVHDRRAATDRVEIAAEEPVPLDRHECDGLYEPGRGARAGLRRRAHARRDPAAGRDRRPAWGR